MLQEKWSKSERRKRSKNCSNPRGFTMKQFCKNLRTHSKKGQKKNESQQLEEIELLEEYIGQVIEDTLIL